MRDLQACATLSNPRLLTRNEQVSGSSPLVGSPIGLGMTVVWAYLSFHAPFGLIAGPHPFAASEAAEDGLVRKSTAALRGRVGAGSSGVVERGTFCGSPREVDTVKVPRALVEHLTETVCYAA